jgi:alkanesulfonate monooxygenase
VPILRERGLFNLGSGQHSPIAPSVSIPFVGSAR